MSIARGGMLRPPAGRRAQIEARRVPRAPSAAINEQCDCANDHHLRAWLCGWSQHCGRLSAYSAPICTPRVRTSEHMNCSSTYSHPNWET